VSEEHLRIQAGFKSGQTITALVAESAFAELKAALGGDEVVELETEDGALVVPARAVSFVKRFTRETSIGFSG
jgi:hypothetical protein